jgi:hypothetical protein
MKRSIKLFAVVALSVLAGLVLKSDRGHGQAQGSQSPVIIRQIFLQNQSTSPGTITLFTPTSSGLYRISLYVNLTPPSNTGSMCPVVDWTDEAGGEYSFFQLGTNALNCPIVGEIGGGSIIIHDLAHNPVTLNPELSDPFNGQYNLLVTVEQL